MHQPYRRLTFLLVAAAVVAAAAAFGLLASAGQVSVRAEAGKWLLTLAAGLFLTGALGTLLRLMDQRRSERAEWHTILTDLVAANQTVMLARLRMAAHRSAKSYQEQLAELLRCRVELRGIGAIGIVNDDKHLSKPVTAMREYLDHLGTEYERHYLRVARQQRLDEAWLTRCIARSSEQGEPPQLPDQLAKPSTAWQQLQDRVAFPRLGALLDESAFPLDEFRANYKRAKTRLETLAGHSGPSPEAAAESARRLEQHTLNFMSKPEMPEMPEQTRRDLEDAHRELLNILADPTDLAEIHDASERIHTVARPAIDAVYPPS